MISDGVSGSLFSDPKDIALNKVKSCGSAVTYVKFVLIPT